MTYPGFATKGEKKGRRPAARIPKENIDIGGLMR